MEKTPNETRPPENNESPVPRRTGPNFLLLLALTAIAVTIFWMSRGPKRSQIDQSFLEKQIVAGKVAFVELGDHYATGTFTERLPAPDSFDAYGKKKEAGKKKLLEQFSVHLLGSDESQEQLRKLLDEHHVYYRASPSSDSAVMMIYLIAIFLPLGLFIFLWFSFRRTRDQIMGGGFLTGFSKSPAKRYEGTQQAVTFQDVAGLEGVKRDLLEVVEYLKDPQKFQRLGGRVPKGVLLNGPPGTGKTLLARAVAGEAEVPFYSVSGSEFIQMFVGVGAGRVRDLFQTAKDNSPAIIFIDEIDAVGRQRGAGLGGGHDEREQTLNQILSEMDGFTQNDSVIVLAATNRPDVLDPALLRPGRFDRHVAVGRPTQKGRIAIFKVHVRDVPLSDDVDLERLASSTIGLTGADIRNMVNEAALWAARNDKNKVEMDDFDYAHDKILMGAKREEVLNKDEKEKTAYHEAGHTLMAWKLPGAYRVHKVTIVPRGRTLGSTQTLPSEERMNMSEGELRDHLVVALGGRAAETLIYNETTAGAESDLERATALARRMVMHWGMSDRLGPVSYKLSDSDPFLGREIHRQRQFSEHTMEVIDEEVAQILLSTANQARSLLEQHRDDLEKITRELLEMEELDEKEIAHLIGPETPRRNQSNPETQAEDSPEDDSTRPNPAESNLAESNLAESNVAESNVAESNVAESNVARGTATEPVANADRDEDS